MTEKAFPWYLLTSGGNTFAHVFAPAPLFANYPLQFKSQYLNLALSKFRALFRDASFYGVPPVITKSLREGALVTPN